jgi:phosphoglycerate-specific signal transduction histidine kinase
VNSSTILLLAPLLLIIVGGFAWMALRRLSRIDEELRTITLLLNDVPKEISIRDYFYAQDRRLFDIREKLDTYSSNEVLQQYIRDQANQIIAFITTHDDSRKSGTAYWKKYYGHCVLMRTNL